MQLPGAARVLLLLLNLAVAKCEVSNAYPYYAATEFGTIDRDGTVRVCATSAPPYIMPGPASSAAGQPLYSYAELLTLPQAGSVFSSTGGNLTLVTGFDVDMCTLVFVDMLGYDLEIRVYGTHLDGLVALRKGECDLFASAAGLDPYRHECPDTASDILDSSFTLSGDYGDANYTAAWRDIQCLEYSAPYTDSGFAIMSLARKRSLDVAAALFAPDAANSMMWLLLGFIVVGWIFCVSEAFATEGVVNISNGMYWSIITLTTVG